MFKVQKQLGERSVDYSQRYWKGIMEKLELLVFFFFLLTTFYNIHKNSETSTTKLHAPIIWL